MVLICNKRHPGLDTNPIQSTRQNTAQDGTPVSINHDSSTGHVQAGQVVDLVDLMLNFKCRLSRLVVAPHLVQVKYKHAMLRMGPLGAEFAKGVTDVMQTSVTSEFPAAGNPRIGLLQALLDIPHVWSCLEIKKNEFHTYNFKFQP